MINPECLVSILLCEEMEDEESILIVGAEQFSLYLKIIVEASSALAHMRISTPLMRGKDSVLALWPWMPHASCPVAILSSTIRKVSRENR